MIHLSSVSSGYHGRAVISDINLSLKKGELLVLAGPNGSGKTTLLKTAAGLLAPLKGTVTINGKDPSRLKIRERASLTAFLFQEKESPWPFTVREAAAHGRFARLGWFGSDTKTGREEVDSALEKAGLLSLADRPVTQISGGELQRVYIARSIAQGADFLLLDEPENNLDPKYSWLVLKLLSALAEEGRAVMLSLHDLRLASRFAHRVCLLSGEGVIAACGPPSEVLEKGTLGRLYDLPPDLAAEFIL